MKLPHLCEVLSSTTCCTFSMTHELMNHEVTQLADILQMSQNFTDNATLLVMFEKQNVCHWQIKDNMLCCRLTDFN